MAGVRMWRNLIWVAEGKSRLICLKAFWRAISFEWVQEREKEEEERNLLSALAVAFLFLLPHSLRSLWMEMIGQCGIFFSSMGIWLERTGRCERARVSLGADEMDGWGEISPAGTGVNSMALLMPTAPLDSLPPVRDTHTHTQSWYSLTFTQPRFRTKQCVVNFVIGWFNDAEFDVCSHRLLKVTRVSHLQLAEPSRSLWLPTRQRKRFKNPAWTTEQGEEPTREEMLHLFFFFFLQCVQSVCLGKRHHFKGQRLKGHWDWHPRLSSIPGRVTPKMQPQGGAPLVKEKNITNQFAVATPGGNSWKYFPNNRHKRRPELLWATGACWGGQKINQNSASWTTKCKIQLFTHNAVMKCGSEEQLHLRGGKAPDHNTLVFGSFKIATVEGSCIKKTHTWDGEYTSRCIEVTEVFHFVHTQYY